MATYVAAVYDQEDGVWIAVQRPTTKAKAEAEVRRRHATLVLATSRLRGGSRTARSHRAKGKHRPKKRTHRRSRR